MKKIKKSKLIMSMVLGMCMTLTGVFGYASVQFILDKVVNQSVTVGSTVQYTEGLFVELESYDNSTLTYFTVDETNTTKHYVTYVYAYTVLVDNVSLEVSTIGDDITVTEFEATESTVTITFSLNQDKDFEQGDNINIQFYFEAVPNEPLNINTATEAELLAIGFTEAEAYEILSSTAFTDIEHMNYMIWIVNLIDRYGEMAENGTIVFE